jgi:hypothetical protein
MVTIFLVNNVLVNNLYLGCCMLIQERLGLFTNLHPKTVVENRAALLRDLVSPWRHLNLELCKTILLLFLFILILYVHLYS